MVFVTELGMLIGNWSLMSTFFIVFRLQQRKSSSRFRQVFVDILIIRAFSSLICKSSKGENSRQIFISKIIGIGRFNFLS